MRVNRYIIKSYSEDSINKMHLVTLKFTGQSNKNDVINIAIRNLTDVHLTDFGN